MALRRGRLARRHRPGDRAPGRPGSRSPAPGDLDDALAAAQGAFPLWSGTPGHDRGAILKRAAALLHERAGDVAAALAVEGGKLAPEAAAEVGRAIETLQWNGEEAGRIDGRIIQGRAPGAQRLSVPEPVGVVAAFTAWNFPAVLAARKLGAALAAGCTVVLKAAEETPRTAAEVVRALADAGLPPGAVNLVFGDPPRGLRAPDRRAAGARGHVHGLDRGRADRRRPRRRRPEALRARAGRARAGDRRAGRRRRRSPCARRCRPSSAPPASRAWRRAGSTCTPTATRQFADAFTAAARELEIGPVITPGRVWAMERMTADAVERGARVLCGGEKSHGEGYFFAPTVLADVPDDALVAREEPFGPIAALAPFTDLDDAVERANGTDYAFAAYLFTDSARTRDRVLTGLRASNIGVNQMAPSMPDAPIGGLQDSGYGYEGGRDGIHAFQHFRLISQAAG